MSKVRTLPDSPAGATLPAPDPQRPVAVIDIGAAAIRLVVAETPAGQPLRIIEDVERGVLLGKDTFTHGRLGVATVEATLRALEGFRRIMDTYGVGRYRAVATSAVREAQNRDTFLDRVRLRTGLDVEVIDGSEENRLTYMAVRDALKEDGPLREGAALLIEVGGGSADISFLRDGEPTHSGTYALGAIRMRQNLASWSGSLEQQARLLRRHVHNVVEDIRSEMPLAEATHMIALGGDAQLAASQVGSPAREGGARIVERQPFLDFCEALALEEMDALVDRFHLSQADAETLVPALLAYRELLLETAASQVTVPDTSLRTGLLLDLVGGREDGGLATLRAQVMASAAALGEKYHYDAAHARQVARLALRLFDELAPEHGLDPRDRVLLEVAALLHDVGLFVGLQGHHKHSYYVLSVSQIFGLSRDDMGVVANVARYHRRAVPQKSHLAWSSLPREARVRVNKMAALLRVANALDADHLQKVEELEIRDTGESLVLEVRGAGELTMERLASLHRADLMGEVFGRRVGFRELGPA